MSDEIKTQEQLDIELYKARLDATYHERNMLLLLSAKLARSMGYNVGWAFDKKKDWEDEWCYVVYIELDKGQISYHLHPKEVEMFKAQLPEYTKLWDLSNKDEHHRLILEHKPYAKSPFRDIDFTTKPQKVVTVNAVPDGTDTRRVREYDDTSYDFLYLPLDSVQSVYPSNWLNSTNTSTDTSTSYPRTWYNYLSSYSRH